MDPITLGLLGIAGIGIYTLKSKSDVPSNFTVDPNVREDIKKNVLVSLNDANNITIPPIEEWVQIDYNNEQWLVAPRYIAPVGIGEALQIAKAHGLDLPTPKMVDAIWNAADLKLQPLPRGPTSKPPSDYTIKTMNSPEANINQLALIDQQIGDKQYKLLAGTHKDVVMGVPTTDPSKPPVIGIYGWHQLNGKPIQGFMWGHSLDWKDYSQGLRLVKKVDNVA